MAYDNGPLILGVTWMESGFTVIAIAVRFFARVTVTNNVGIDDWVMLLAVLLQLLSQSFLTLMVHWGLGRHISTLSPEQIVEFLKWSCLSQIPGVLSTSLARISVAILLWRLFGVKAWFRWYLYVMTALLIAVSLTLLTVWGAQCRPINALWGPVPGGSCWNPNIELAITQIFQSICTVIDFTYALFPIIVIWHLSLKLRVKLVLMAVLSFGLLAMIASIIKTMEDSKILNRTDPSYNFTNVTIWLMTEQNLVIIVGCVPVWRSLFTRKSDKHLAFSSLLSKYFPPVPEMRKSATADLEALHGVHEDDLDSKAESNPERRNVSSSVENLPMPHDRVEFVRKDSIELPSLDLIGKPSKRTGSP